MKSNIELKLNIWNTWLKAKQSEQAKMFSNGHIQHACDEWPNRWMQNDTEWQNLIKKFKPLCLVVFVAEMLTEVSHLGLRPRKLLPCYMSLKQSSSNRLYLGRIPPRYSNKNFHHIHRQQSVCPPGMHTLWHLCLHLLMQSKKKFKYKLSCE